MTLRTMRWSLSALGLVTRASENDGMLELDHPSADEQTRIQDAMKELQAEIAQAEKELKDIEKI